MRVVRQIVVLFAIIRLLVPPGICLCHDHSPVLQLLLTLANPKDEPPPSPDDNDEHDPGCPCSPLSAGMGLRPAPVNPPCPLDVPGQILTLLPDTLVPSRVSLPAASRCTASGTPSHSCVLLL